MSYVDLDNPAKLITVLKKAVRVRNLQWPQELQDEYGGQLSDREKQREAAGKLSQAILLGWEYIIGKMEEQIHSIGEPFESFRFKEKETARIKYFMAQFIKGWEDSGQLEQETEKRAREADVRGRNRKRIRRTVSDEDAKSD